MRPGSFLVRHSSRDRCMVLSVLDNHGGIQHFRVQELGGGRLRLENMVDGTLSFENLRALVHHFRQPSSAGLGVALTMCIPPP